MNQDEIPDGPCVECDGSGYLDDDQSVMCDQCEGTGIENDSE